jgi:hypothetical protein
VAWAELARVGMHGEGHVVGLFMSHSPIADGEFGSWKRFLLVERDGYGVDPLQRHLAPRRICCQLKMGNDTGASQVRVGSRPDMRLWKSNVDPKEAYPQVPGVPTQHLKTSVSATVFGLPSHHARADVCERFRIW